MQEKLTTSPDAWRQWRERLAGEARGAGDMAGAAGESDGCKRRGTKRADKRAATRWAPIAAAFDQDRSTPPRVFWACTGGPPPCPEMRHIRHEKCHLDTLPSSSWAAPIISLPQTVKSLV